MSYSENIFKTYGIDMKKKILSIMSLMVLCTACTYSITQVQTKGTASDVVDDTDTPTANVTAEVPISVIPK